MQLAQNHKVDPYNRVDFVCPTLKIAVNLLDGYSRPIQEMNENLFRRKWNGTEQELQKHIENETLDWFCDRTKSGMKCKVGKFQVGNWTFIACVIPVRLGSDQKQCMHTCEIIDFSSGGKINKPLYFI